MQGMQALSTNISISWMEANTLAVSMLNENNSQLRFLGLWCTKSFL